GPRGPVPSWLYAAVARGLAVRPDDRWSSVKALLEALTTGRARARRRRMWLGVGAIVLSGGAAVAWQGWNRAQRVAGCERAGTEIAEIWNDDAKLALRGALLHTGVPFAEITHDKLVPWVDRWTRAWSDMRTESCIEAEVER